MIVRKCLYCNQIFKTYRAWLRKGKAGNFCSRSCARKAAPHRNYRIKKYCVICNVEFTVKRYRVKTAVCCSDRCRAIYVGRITGGKNHRNWKGGFSERDFKSRKIIDKLKKQRGKCQDCGKTEKLHGHHIVEWAKNKSKRYEEDNIEILCGDCHALRHPHLKGMLKIDKLRSGKELECKICKKLYYVSKYKIGFSRWCSRVCQMKGLLLINNKRKNG